MTRSDQLKLLNKTVRTSDRTWASERGLELLRQLPIRPPDRPGDFETFTLDMTITDGSKIRPFWIARFFFTVRENIRMLVTPPSNVQLEIVGDALRELPNHRRTSLTFIRKPVTYAPKDLATLQINVYAIEVGMRAKSSPIGLIRDPLSALESNKLEVNAISIAETMGLSFDEAIVFARKAYETKHGSMSNASSSEQVLSSLDSNIFLSDE